RSAQRRLYPQRVSSANCRGVLRPATQGQYRRHAGPGPARPDPPRTPRGRARPGPAPHHRNRIAMTIAAKFEIEYLQYLDADGKLAGKLPPAVKDAKALLPLFKQMLYVRTFDTKAIALQRTGKLGTYASCLGHEATHIGIGASMQPEDVFAPSYREYGAQFMRGVK